METTEQRRARETWQRLIAGFGAPSEWKKPETGASDYLSALKSTPARIHSCGLGQAIAFLKSRKDDPSKKAASAARNVSELVLSMLGLADSDLIARIRQSNATFLFLATDEAIRVIGWLSRYLEGEGVTTKQEGKQQPEEART